MNKSVLFGSMLFASVLAIAYAQAAPPKAEERTHPITVTGRALDPDGKPVEGATIFLVGTSGEGRLLSQSTTGADGSYQFSDVKLPVPNHEDKSFFENGTFRLFGKAPGRAFAWRGTRTLCIDPRFLGGDGKLPPKQREAGYLPGEKIELDLTFAVAYPIRGRITDEMGRPVPKVRLDLANCDFMDKRGKETHVNVREFAGTSSKLYRDLLAEQLFAISDAEGRFEFSHVPPDLVCWLLVEHAEFARMSLYTATSKEPPTTHDEHPVQALPLDLKLHSVRRIPVQVTYYDTEKPAPGAQVRAYQSRASGTAAWGEADENGRFVLKLPPGKYQLSASPGPGTHYISTTEELTVEDKPAEQPVSIKLDSGCVILFKAVDADSGKGIAGISFWYEPDEQKDARRTVQPDSVLVSNPKTDKNGELRAVVRPGKRNYGLGFFVFPDGYRPADPDDGAKGREVICPAGQKVVLEFKMRK